MEGAPKIGSQQERISHAEDFVFDGEMLKSAEGRKKTFREMVRMYNAVRNKRDALGFEKNTQVRDEDFDGYVAFRIRYFKLRKRIAEFSEMGVSHAEDGTPNGLIEHIEIPQQAMQEFERGFAYLKKYYERTTTFASNEDASQPVAVETENSEEEQGPAHVETGSDDEGETQARHIASVIERSEAQSAATQDIDDINWMGLSNAFKEREQRSAEPGEAPITPHTENDGEVQKDRVMDEMVSLGEEYARHLNRTSPEAKKDESDAKMDEMEALGNEYVRHLRKDGPTLEGARSANETWDSLWEIPAPEGEAVPQKAYEKRNELRAIWKEKKEAYEQAYAEYLEDRQNGGLLRKARSYFRKEEQPQDLLALEQEYLASRQQYASMLDDAFIRRLRLKEDVGAAYKQERSVSIRAGLAHRFVIKAAHEKLRLEQEYVPNSAALRTLDKMQESFAKNSKIIKRVGFVAAAGIGLATGGVSAALLALGGRFVAAKFAFAGGTVGALAAGKLYDAAILEKRERRKDGAFALTQKSFSVERIGELESLYFDTYRSYESALKNRKYAVLGGALAGSAAGAMVSGELSMDVPNTPQESITIPPLEESEEVPLAPEAPAVTPLPPEALGTPDTVFIPEVEDIPNTEVLAPTVPIEGSEPSEDGEYVPEAEIVPVPFVFEAGSNVDTVSEALFETWKENPELSDEPLTRREFLAQMYTTIAEL